MLNGRSTNNNDYTSISTKRLAVVDYVIVPYQDLQKCTNFEVLRACHLFDNAGLLGVCDPDHNIADHLVLSWSYKLKETIVLDTDQSNINWMFLKYQTLLC